ncbi:hypothetical protein FYJ27_03930 [Anaerosalibacter bizertensis]|uniref:CNNM transmembrane domain-containing protein n=1 Tax=Anaerosalibacter bizertensis TaxID=932217 RepID=A0A844FG03_9FIRM|nr:CNNM domain-containing protein [Anaerosalibacter bizertensis]MBV1817397.1 hypothetical protein [Bacteroidales bacterium MSK.15.36]HHV26212.1 hypothetical protein [Tissierellia bacterium]MBU5293172.1 hypothetical protein [Anaerosalibacter bizertensis]MCB5558477.1 hypothetical protein [Anaerosalibacter bizertensis]MCG4564241.1 hypothetical protein [Anaerosalibacter bizertensis]
MRRKSDDAISHKQTKKWVIVISVWTFVMAIFFSLITEKLMKNLDVFFAFIILIIIILLGILFDIIGIAVTASDEKPFHSMAANKVEEAKHAIKLIKNAGQVSNFCNDVIGDISGIVSGSAGTIIIYNLINKYNIKNGTILSIIITALIASFTVGGKAVGKEIAINNSEKIIFKMAKVLNFLENNFKIKLFKNQTK